MIAQYTHPQKTVGWQRDSACCICWSILTAADFESAKLHIIWYTQCFVRSIISFLCLGKVKRQHNQLSPYVAMWITSLSKILLVFQGLWDFTNNTNNCQRNIDLPTTLLWLPLAYTSSFFGRGGVNNLFIEYLHSGADAQEIQWYELGEGITETARDQYGRSLTRLVRKPQTLTFGGVSNWMTSKQRLKRFVWVNNLTEEGANTNLFWSLSGKAADLFSSKMTHMTGTMSLLGRISANVADANKLMGDWGNWD